MTAEDDRARGEFANRRLHSTFAVVEPLRNEPLQRVPTELSAESENLPLTDACSAQQREVVPPPLLGCPDAHLAHPDNVVSIPEVLLDLHAREDQSALLVDVPRRREVCGWLRCTVVCLMRLCEDGEAVIAVAVDHRN